MTRKSTEKRLARERQQRMSAFNPLKQRASYRSALHHVRGPEPELGEGEFDAAQKELDEWAATFAAKWFATPITDIVAKITKPITNVQRAMGITEASRTMLAIRGPSTFHESDRFDRLAVFERVRQITRALGQPPVLGQMLERSALESILPNRSAGRMLAWASRESEDPYVRAYSDAAWANERVRPWRAWVGLILRLHEEHPRLNHAARMIVENDLKDAERCFAQTDVPESMEARSALAGWLLKHLKTAD